MSSAPHVAALVAPNAETTPNIAFARARDRLGGAADLRLIDGSRLPVDDASADLVLVSLVLHSVGRDEAVGILREACSTCLT